MAFELAIHSRWLRALRLGCSAPASNEAPTTCSGKRRLAYCFALIVAEPDVGRSRPMIMRIVVDFPLPLGPRNPVT